MIIMNVLGWFLIRHWNPISKNSTRVNKTDKNMLVTVLQELAKLTKIRWWIKNLKEQNFLLRLNIVLKLKKLVSLKLICLFFQNKYIYNGNYNIYNGN